MTKWVDAIAKIDKPSWTNREAGGVIHFARTVAAKYPPHVAAWDWYPYALVGLGWHKPGDKFVVSTAHQLQPYPATAKLRAALLKIANALDASGIPFSLVADPRGSDASHKRLAAEAWTIMQRVGEPESLQRLTTEELASSAASSSSSSAASSPGNRPTLRLGSRGPDVAELQRKLGIAADGVFGPATRAAVVAMQKRAGIAADGVAGRDTWNMLDFGAVGPATEPRPAPGPQAEREPGASKPTLGPVAIAMPPPAKKPPPGSKKPPTKKPAPAPAPETATPAPAPETAKPSPETAKPPTEPGGDASTPPEPGSGPVTDPSIQPVDEPVKAPSGGGGGGAALLLLLLAFGGKRSGRKKRR